MLFRKRTIALLVLLGLFQFTQAQTPTAEELVGIHVLTETQINAIASPITGTLVFNTDKNALQQYDGTDWTVPETVSTFVDNMDGTFTYTNEKNESITIGTIGPQGPKGDTGDQGPEGPQGNATITNLIQTTGTGIITYTNEDSTPQTANVISADANNSIEVGSDGGAFSTAKFVDVYDSNNSYTVNLNTFRKVRFNTVRLNQGGIFSIANNEITVSKAGTYEIEYGVAYRTNAHAIGETKIQINGVDLIASRAYNGGWYKDVTASRKIYLSMNANDVISVWVQRTQFFNSSANSLSTIKDGSFLLVKKLD